jgi:hypothetical protein
MQNFTNTSPDSVDEFLSHNVSSNQKEILEFLKRFDLDAYNLYKAGIYHFLNKELPMRVLILSHCFWELSSVFSETDVNKQKVNMQETLKEALEHIDFEKRIKKCHSCGSITLIEPEQFSEMLKESFRKNLNLQEDSVNEVVNIIVEFIQGYCNREAKKDKPKEILAEIFVKENNFNQLWKKINPLIKNKSHNILKTLRNSRPEGRIRIRLRYGKFNPAYNAFGRMRHWNKSNHSKSELEKYENTCLPMDIKNLEDVILGFIPEYDEDKKVLDKILQKANTPPYTNPTDNELKDTIGYLKQRVFNEYFFSELKNPEWIKFLEEKKLLYFWKDSANCYAERYLLEIADKKPDEVYDVIKLFWDDLRQDEMLERLLYHTIFEIGIKMSKTKKECLLSMAKDFLSYLKATKSSLMHVISSKFIIDILKALANIGYEEKALEIFSECLKLDINAIPEPPDIHEMHRDEYEKLKSKYPDFFTEPYAQRYDFVMVTRFGKDNNNSLYDYEELLREGNEVFQQKPKELFKIYCDIIGTSLKSLSNKHKEKFLDYIYITHLATIKHEQQDVHRQHCPLCTIVSALRYCAENLLKSEDKCNVKYVFGMLQKREKENKIFLCLILHLLRLFPTVDRDLTEAYITKKDCFDDTNLHYEYFLLLKQEFGNLSEKGRKIIFDHIDSLGDNLELPWLEYIKEHLSKSEQEKYKHILYKDGKEQHSQYLKKFDSPKVGYPTSPLKPDKMQEMSVEEIIKYSENIKYALDNYGFSQSLEHDVKQNTRKYLDGLLKFKGVSKPIYIVGLFSGLQGAEKTESDWKNIAELGLWTLEQKTLPANEKIPFKNWTDVYITLLILFEDLFKSERLQVGDEVAKSIYGIIKKLLFVSEGHLLLKELEPNYGDLKYADTASNNLYGIAVESLIQYVTWQYKNKKDITDITLVLDELLNKSKYEETWTLLGCHLLNLYLLFQDWTKQNINKILPVNDNTKFKAARITYIIIISNVADKPSFDLCKDKFEYALKNKLYIADERYIKDLGRHISLHYAITKQINLGDDMMKLIFNIPELLQSMINFIGESLKGKNWSEENIDRFKSLWDWIISNSNAANQSKYHCGLKEFQLWYGYGYKSFSDREWLLDRMYNLVVKYKIDMGMSFFHNTKEALQEDLPKHSRKVFEIVRKHEMAREEEVGDKEVIKKVLGYIKNNTFEKDNSLKREADAFINWLGKSYGNKLFDEFKEYLNYPLTNS